MRLAPILLIIFYKISIAQTNLDTVYQFELAATASSLISFFEEERYPGSDNYQSMGFGFFVRAMWHPARLLSVGLMTGYCQIAKDEFKDSVGTTASASLSAIPLQLAVSMQGENFELGLGMGPYLMITNIDFYSSAQASRYELGITSFAAYTFSLGDNIKIGPELRVLYLSYRKIVSIFPSLFIRFEILRY
jgi:hypothetical protein